MPNKVTVELSGPLFNNRVRTATLKGVNRKLLSAVAAHGKRNYQKLLQTNRGKDTGAYRRTIRRRTKKKTASVYSDDPRVSTWLEGTQARQRSGSVAFRGYRLWDRATRETDATAGREARKISAELAGKLNRGL